MLSIGRLGTSGGANYYLDKVANNVDDYYLGRGEAPGQWIGATTERLGLVGQVDPQACATCWPGLLPRARASACSCVRNAAPGTT